MNNCKQSKRCSPFSPEKKKTRCSPEILEPRCHRSPEEISPPRRQRQLSEVTVAEAGALISLPPDVLDDILTRDGLRDVVRTSALSQAWRRRWEALPSIELNFPRPKDGKKGLRAVDGILLRYPGRIRRFDIYLDHDLDSLYAGRIDDWLIVLSRRGVETFYLFSADGFIALPSSVFSYGRITILRLCGCTIPFLPVGFEGFPELRDLALMNVRFREHEQYQLEEIIAASPLLKELVLLDVKIAGGFTEWVIQAPNLEKLTIRSAKDLGWNPGELLSLGSAEIEIWDYLGTRDFGKFLTGFANITKLVIYTRHPPAHTNASI